VKLIFFEDKIESTPFPKLCDIVSLIERLKYRKALQKQSAGSLDFQAKASNEIGCIVVSVIEIV
jgi:hypothetical protein